MKQLVQQLALPKPAVIEVPAPKASAGTILVQAKASLVSAGTERMIVDFVEKSLLEKARSRPDLVKQTMEKARREGVLQTLDAVRNRLDGGMPLGYSSAGVVVEVGEGVGEVSIGDRVACAGAGAAHGEVLKIPKNLAVVIPHNVTYEEAAFSTLGAIALQGFRLADVKLGERVGVIGLGLLGLLSVQLLRAAGCQVVGFDLVQERADLSIELGATGAVVCSEAFETLCSDVTNGRGLDAVLITADTSSDEPVALAGEVSRDKGIVVAVGAVGTNLPRKTYFERELDFRISRSYGPGRYDPEYEDKGHDYPFGYVRWTEQRNMGAILSLIGDGKLDVEKLTSHRYEVVDAAKAYDLITQKTGESFLGVVLTYPEVVDFSRTLRLKAAPSALENRGNEIGLVKLAVLGAGNYANATLLPALQKMASVELRSVASGRGLNAKLTADRFGFLECSTDSQSVMDDSNVNTVAVLTPHNLHARQVISALDAGKNVFVEKPLCLNEDELAAVVDAFERVNKGPSHRSLVVGFNRRFAPFVRLLRDELESVHEPLMVTCRINAGFLPKDHWTQDAEVGGGRLLGEGCHFVDLVIHLVGAVPKRVTTFLLDAGGKYNQDNFQITMEFEDGSLGCIHYMANGDRGFGKELIEVSGGGLSARMDDYRSLTIRGGGKNLDKTARLRPDKGHAEFFKAFALHLTKGAAPPISFREVVLSTAVTLAAEKSLRMREPVDVDWGA
ncbi:MAG: Gfo/Idh/MocA family oxidoreductase [Deltaproteobacteria bacterium]|nr:Gfo/Idh/MocA family oxidoreductase [Deltaproteobacteria bacterium]